MPDWLTAILADTTALQLVFWVVALAALIGAIIKVWPILSKAVTIVNAVSGLPAFIKRTDETLTAQDAKIADIHHEVHYNNGSSVKDAIGRVEEGVKGIYTRLDTADQDRRELREDLEETRPHAPARKRPTKPKEN
ncbi:MAG: hypothetical protein JWP85_2144 [Rhodoglobus sp.]|nr:hypothetical protein [Rhodoglobus sp.]